MLSEPTSTPRRTQKERRDGTRRLLLTATIEALVELGYRGATTLEVERRAGVSRGARLHHFPTKAALLAAAVDHLYNQLGDHYEQAFGRFPAGVSDAERFHSGLRLLWSIYRRPDYVAALELQMASRTDHELREHLRVVGERHREIAVEAARQLFPELNGDQARAVIEAVHASLVGLLMQLGVNTPEEGDFVAELVLGSLDQVMAAHLASKR